MARAARIALHFLAISVLTMFTQVGGACYLAGIAAAVRASTLSGLADALGLRNAKLRFAGCHAARR